MLGDTEIVEAERKISSATRWDGVLVVGSNRGWLLNRLLQVLLLGVRAAVSPPRTLRILNKLYCSSNCLAE